ncbi:MAG: ATP-binding protein, partial [Thiomicrorhabdus sp.]|nr:ATP-binding protein [Thiomicrorhabdus sp.]
PVITIKALKKEQTITVWVEDNGLGIPIELMDKIFDPFFTTKEVGKGTGLGLSISYQLLKEMNAELSVWNKLEGGAVFQIQLNSVAQI